MFMKGLLQPSRQDSLSWPSHAAGCLTPSAEYFWFGVDDTFYTVYTPMYCGMTAVPHSFAVGNGDIMTYSETSGFWVFNEVTNFVYTRASVMTPDLQAKQKELEQKYVTETS